MHCLFAIGHRRHPYLQTENVKDMRTKTLPVPSSTNPQRWRQYVTLNTLCVDLPCVQNLIVQESCICGARVQGGGARLPVASTFRRNKISNVYVSVSTFRTFTVSFFDLRLVWVTLLCGCGSNTRGMCASRWETMTASCQTSLFVQTAPALLPRRAQCGCRRALAPHATHFTVAL